MERRFQARLDELRHDARVPPGLLRGLAPRLDTFLRPFVAALLREEQRDNAGRYVRGLLSNLGAKTAEGIGVGSTLGQIQDAYADLTPVEPAGFDQSGNYVVDGDRYLGFLYNENAVDATESSKVVFMEVTKGDKPELIRDGC